MCVSKSTCGVSRRLEPSFPNVFILWVTCSIVLLPRDHSPVSIQVISFFVNIPLVSPAKKCYKYDKNVKTLLHVKFNININTILKRNLF